MMQLFHTIEGMSETSIGAIICAVSLIFLLIPFLSIIQKAFRALLSNEAPEIRDFSWRLIPNPKLSDEENRTLYLSSGEPVNFIQGTSLMLNWDVRGSFRIDLHPIKKRIQGNTALVPIHKGTMQFKLVAFTWRGKFVEELTIPSNALHALQSLNLSEDGSFGQPAHEWIVPAMSNAPKWSAQIPKKVVLDSSFQWHVISRRLNSKHPPGLLQNQLNTETLAPVELNYTRRHAWSPCLKPSTRDRLITFKPAAYSEAILNLKQIKPQSKTSNSHE